MKLGRLQRRRCRWLPVALLLPLLNGCLLTGQMWESANALTVDKPFPCGIINAGSDAAAFAADGSRSPGRLLVVRPRARIT